MIEPPPDAPRSRASHLASQARRALLESGPARWLQRSARARRILQRELWKERWGRGEFSADWRLAGVDPSVARAVGEGWIPAGARILDVGCGDGAQAHWLAERGHAVLGIDIAAPAIRLARAGAGPGGAEFAVLDICAEAPAGGPFDAILDRGCFHQILPPDRPGMAANLLRVATSEARVLLLVRGFRGPEEFDLRADQLGPERRDAAVREVRDAFEPDLGIVEVEPCCFDTSGRRGPGWAIRLARGAPPG